MGRSGKFRWGAVSITGNFRSNNEDKFFVDPEGRYFLVADGMGGQSAGEKASELAIDLIPNRLNSLIDFEKTPTAEVIQSIDKAVSHANAEIMALGELEPSCKNMGTTIAFVIHVRNELFVGGLGDSRVYLLREGGLQQLTEDHTLTQALVNAKTITPEDAKTHRYKNMLYRYLGTKDGSKGTEPKTLAPQSGDRLMICSDGISDGTDPDLIRNLLTSESEPQQAAEKLVAAAQAGGSKDNITCVVVYVD